MKFCKLFCVVFISLVLGACAKKSSDGAAGHEGAAPINSQIAGQRIAKPNLAYEHFFDIEYSHDQVAVAYHAALDECAKLLQQQCTILESSLQSRDEQANAKIVLRISADGVAPLISKASENGQIQSQKLQAEDLSQPIADTQQQLTMQTAYRDKLLNLESHATQNIDSLIKISSELARIQSQIESHQTNLGEFTRRIALDRVSITLSSKYQYSAWGEVGDAIAEFDDALAEGIATAIVGVGYLLPWTFVLLLFLLFGRWIWRKTRVKAAAKQST